MKESLIDLLGRVMTGQIITYKGCVIIRTAQGIWQHGAFIGTLKECRERIDKNFIIWNKTIEK